MSQDDDSLGDQQTFAGSAKNTDSKSLGDELTFGGSGPEGEAPFADEMEIVDLAARYTIESTLGQGGMGEVLLALDTRLNRKVAIKRILGDASSSRTAVKRFLTEAKSIAALNHSNIVQIYDYGQAADGPFLIMEYVDGKNLLEYCQNGALPLEEAVELTCQLCDGLTKAHEAGIIHRDIKPANVLMAKDGVPKLTDFGLAKAEASDTSRTMAGAVLGTLDFMSPEQRQDAALTDSRSDLWSLAATLYQLVTGKSPKIIKFNDVPQALHEVLGKALEDNKDDRYQSAREFRDALRASLLVTSSDEPDLGEGECPHCGTKNDSTRKFCRSCAESLIAPCLSCSVGMPMWEEVCGDCGTKQSSLLEERRASMSAQQSKAKDLLKDYEFEEASHIAIALRDEPDLRLRQSKDWSEKFLLQVEQGHVEQVERISSLMQEAVAHQQAYDYSSGIHSLQQIPENLRSESIAEQSLTAGELLDQLEQQQARSQQLDQVIRQRVKSRELNGLQDEVDQLLELRPDRQDIQKLKEQLTQREAKLIKTRDEAFATAQRLMETQDYARVVQELKRIDPFIVHSEIASLQREAEEKLDQLQSLERRIATALDQKKYDGLLKQVEECLTLKQGDTELQKLRDRLTAREEKHANQIGDQVEKAEGLRGACRFNAAVKALQRIPQNLQTQKSLSLIEECDFLAGLRETAMQSLTKAMESEEYADGLKEAKEYATALEREILLQDKEFAQGYANCKQGFQDQREAEEAAIRQKALMRKLGFGAMIVVAVALMVTAEFWIQSSVKARALAEAVNQQKWDEALAIDGEYVPALIGRAKQRLYAGTLDIEGAFTDLTLVEQINSTTEGLKSTKALAFVKRAKANADIGKIRDAEKDLKKAEELRASEYLLTPTKKSLAAYYNIQAETAATTKNSAVVFSNVSRAIELDDTVVLSAQVVKVWAEEAVSQFEKDSSSAKRDLAIVSVRKLANTADRRALRQRVAVVMLKRSEKLASIDPAASAFELASASEFEGELNALKTQKMIALKAQIVTALTTRFLQSIDRHDEANASADFSKLQKMAPKVADSLVSEFGKLSSSIRKVTNGYGKDLKAVLQKGIDDLESRNFQNFIRSIYPEAELQRLDSPKQEKYLISRLNRQPTLVQDLIRELRLLQELKAAPVELEGRTVVSFDLPVESAWNKKNRSIDKSKPVQPVRKVRFELVNGNWRFR